MTSLNLNTALELRLRWREAYLPSIKPDKLRAAEDLHLKQIFPVLFSSQQIYPLRYCTRRAIPVRWRVPNIRTSCTSPKYNHKKNIYVAQSSWAAFTIQGKAKPNLSMLIKQNGTKRIKTISYNTRSLYTLARWKEMTKCTVYMNFSNKDTMADNKSNSNQLTLEKVNPKSSQP